MVVAEDDALGLGRLGDHLLERAASVLVFGADPDAVDRFGRRLVQSLRARSQDAPVQVSVLFEMTRELLIERFNQRLAHLTLDDARQADRQAGAQVWVMHAHGDEQVSLARLVMRLVNDFPGAGVRLLVLAPSAVESALRAAPESQGLLRCTLAALPTTAVVAHTEFPSLDETGEEAPARRRYGLLAVLLGGIVLLGLSALLVAFLSPDRGRRSSEATAVPAAAVSGPAREVRPVDGRRWAQQLVGGQWVVQHVALSTEAEMATWRTARPGLDELKVVPVVQSEHGDRYFVAVSGPFVDRTTAERFVRQNQLPSTAWVRSAGSLKAVLAPEVDGP